MASSQCTSLYRITCWLPIKFAWAVRTAGRCRSLAVKNNVNIIAGRKYSYADGREWRLSIASLCHDDIVCMGLFSCKWRPMMMTYWNGEHEVSSMRRGDATEGLLYSRRIWYFHYVSWHHDVIDFHGATVMKTRCVSRQCSSIAIK